MDRLVFLPLLCCTNKIIIMKFILTFSFLLVSLCSIAFAQSGNVVVSNVRFYEVGEGQGQIEVQIAGNLVSTVADAKISLSGERIIIGKDVVFSKPMPGSGNQATIVANFALGAAGSGENNDEVTAIITLRRIGNGLDYTYSRVGRIRRPTGI